jgi:hypothetical protein
MPVAWTMNVWVPGGDPMTLPTGVAMALPAGDAVENLRHHVGGELHLRGSACRDQPHCDRGVELAALFPV